MRRLTQIVAWMLMATVSVHGANFLCVGLNEYEDYGNLRFAEKDAAEIAGLLSEQGHDVSLLVGENVTRENVINALQDESTIVYFAGHGEKGYMVLADGQTRSLECRCHGFRGWAQRYERIGALLEGDALQTGQVLAATVHILDAETMWAQGEAALHRDPFFFVEQVEP